MRSNPIPIMNEMPYYYGEPGGTICGPMPLLAIRNAVTAGTVSQDVLVALAPQGPWMTLANASRKELAAGAVPSQPAKAKAADHESYWSYTVVSMLLPFIGLILGIVCLVRPEPVDRKLGEHCLALSVFMGVIYALLLPVVVPVLLAR